MKRYKVKLGRSIVIVNEEKEEVDFWGEPKGYKPLPKEEKYALIAISAVNEAGETDYLFIGQQPNAEDIVKALKEDEAFMVEAHFTVWHKDKKLMEFDGTLFDCLLIAANEGEKYDV